MKEDSSADKTDDLFTNNITCTKANQGKSRYYCMDTDNGNSDTIDLTLQHNATGHKFDLAQKFRQLVTSGPEFVCTCCTQTFFEHSVTLTKKLKFPLIKTEKITQKKLKELM